jgi:SAM-dependent methyltransferase
LNFETNNCSLSDYTPIATEYYDAEKHRTCHNFMRLSRRYIGEELGKNIGNGRFLELGAGNSAVAAWLHANGYSLKMLEITDASEAMLSHSKRWISLGATLKVVDANALPYGDSSFDCVVASLADPYNLPTMWHAIARVLKPQGRAIVTLPSYEWAVRFRPSPSSAASQSADFLLSDGSAVQVPSYVHPMSYQIDMIEKAGLMLSCFCSFGVEELAGEELSPKIRVFDGPVSSLVWGFTAQKLWRG